jgi:hypothetical protein
MWSVTVLGCRFELNQKRALPGFIGKSTRHGTYSLPAIGPARQVAYLIPDRARHLALGPNGGGFQWMA